MRTLLISMCLLVAPAAYAETPPPSDSPDRTLEIVTFAVSAAATAAALGFWTDAYTRADDLTREVPTPRRVEYAAELWGRQQMAMGATLVGVGLTALTGVLAFRPADDGLKPSALFTPDGGFIGLGGRF